MPKKRARGESPLCPQYIRSLFYFTKLKLIINKRIL
nr:MAG TPA_asm: hypothetical protein [Caudoviricetes sp.]DAN07258.1 MAG TPA: hypothetical protein [Caudoviricetes sp.]